MTAAKIQDANNNNKKTRQRDEVGHGNDDHSEEFLSLPRCKAQRDREAEEEEANITFNYNIAAFYLRTSGSQCSSRAVNSVEI